MDLEKVLREIIGDDRSRFLSVHTILNELKQKNLIDDDYGLPKYLLPTLNGAVHGASVDKATAERIINIASSAMNKLRRKQKPIG